MNFTNILVDFYLLLCDKNILFTRLFDCIIVLSIISLQIIFVFKSLMSRQTDTFLVTPWYIITLIVI